MKLELYCENNKSNFNLRIEKDGKAYILSQFPDSVFIHIQTETGEGMGLNEALLYDVIDRFYKSNF